MEITLTVNGQEATREIEPRLLLVHLLRDDLGLTGPSSHQREGFQALVAKVTLVWVTGTLGEEAGAAPPAQTNAARRHLAAN